MSRQSRLVDCLQRGMGTAALRIGAMYDGFRPPGAFDPLDVDRRFVRLPVAFALASHGGGSGASDAQMVWQGIYDTSYTLPGDYLRGPEGIFFVASQRPLLPVLCILTNRTVSVSRPSRPRRAGVNSYGGVMQTADEVLLRNWPASLLLAGEHVGHDEVGLPGGGGSGTFSLLLPPLPQVAPVPTIGDLVADDLGSVYVVSADEQTALGWRLTVRQVNS